MGFTEMKDRNSDVKGAGDPKSEGEKQKPTFECDHHIFKKGGKIRSWGLGWDSSFPGFTQRIGSLLKEKKITLVYILISPYDKLLLTQFSTTQSFSLAFAS